MAGLLKLGNDQVQATVSPEWGGSLMGLRARVGDRWVALMPEAGLPGCDLAAASFVMAPYSNRIAEGRFSFGGVVHQLQNGANHAIHGDVRKRRWTLVHADLGEVRLGFASTEFPDINWPWAFDAALTYRIAGATLSMGLELTNRANMPMPAGGGFHPYFQRAPTRVGEPVEVQFAVAGIYPDAAGTRIPSGPAERVPIDRNYSKGRVLDPRDFLDFCAMGYGGAGAITWRETGVRLNFRASRALDHLVFYNPPKPYFAVEPVSNANDGVNLLARGDATSGVRILEPGERLEVELSLGVEVVG